MYRVSRICQEPVIDADQVEAIEPAIRASEPGKFDVDEIAANPGSPPATGLDAGALRSIIRTVG